MWRDSHKPEKKTYVVSILLITKLRFANTTFKGPTFAVWMPRFKEIYISGSALEVRSAVKRLRVSIVLGYAMLASSNKSETVVHCCHFLGTSAAHA